MHISGLALLACFLLTIFAKLRLGDNLQGQLDTFDLSIKIVDVFIISMVSPAPFHPVPGEQSLQ